MPLGALILLGVIWGGVMSAIKFVSLSGFPSFSYVFWALLISTLLLLFANLARTRRLPPRHLAFYALCGLFSFAIPQTVTYVVLESIPAGLLALILATTPIMTYVIAMAIREERFHHLKALGVVMGFAGSVLLVLSNASDTTIAPIDVIVLALSIPLCYAIYTAAASRFMPARLDPLQMSTGMLIAATLTMLMVVWQTDSYYPLWHGSPIQIALLVYHSFATAVAFTILNALIKHTGALFSSLSTYFVTLFGILIGAVVHDEVLPAIVWAAACLILGGLGFIQRGRQVERG